MLHTTACTQMSGTWRSSARYERRNSSCACAPRLRPVIRSIALFTFKPGTSPEEIAAIETALRAFRLKGMRRC